MISFPQEAEIVIRVKHYTLQDKSIEKYPEDSAMSTASLSVVVRIKALLGPSLTGKRNFMQHGYTVYVGLVIVLEA